MNLYQGPIWNRLYGGLGHFPQPWQCVHQCETGEKMNPEARCPWFRWKIIVAHILIFCHQVSVLEERLCDFKKWRWTPFDRHIDHFNLTKMGTGKVTMAAMMMASLLSAHNCISSLLMIWQICQIWYTNTKGHLISGASHVANWNRLWGIDSRRSSASDEEHPEN